MYYILQSTILKDIKSIQDVKHFELPNSIGGSGRDPNAQK